MEGRIRALAKIARASGITREEAIQKLTPFGDATFIVDEIYKVRQEVAERETLAAMNEILPKCSSGEGLGVDSEGLDQADRAALSALLALGEPD
jgi:hypothetical protein